MDVSTLQIIVAAIPPTLAGVASLVVSLRNGRRNSRKLDGITLLVDGRYGDVLQELADVKRLLAAQTGSASDHTRAEVAQKDATAQHERTAAAGRPRGNVFSDQKPDGT